MELQPYKAEDLFEWVTNEGNDFLLIDVRNDEEEQEIMDLGKNECAASA
ncbi:MAG: hypothetical protein HQ557_04875 [Bacteroidetes bacterium]|nr:hypothetical protein [Bacteroidota bacterium]